VHRHGASKPRVNALMALHRIRDTRAMLAKLSTSAVLVR